MIKDGARLVTCARDVLLDLHQELRHLIDGLPDVSDGPEGGPPPMPKELDGNERAIFEALELDPLPFDQLSEALAETGMGTGDLMASLLSLELRGLIRQEPGKRFRRTR